MTLEQGGTAFTAGQSRQRQDPLHALLIRQLIAFGLVEHHGDGITADRLPQSGFCGGTTGMQREGPQQGGDVAIKQSAFAGAGTAAEPDVGSPAQGTTDRGEHHPAEQEGAMGWHVPEEAIGDAHDHRCLLDAERLDITRAMEALHPLVDVAGGAGVRDRLLTIGGDEAITEVEQRPAVIPPGTAATDALR